VADIVDILLGDVEPLDMPDEESEEPGRVRADC
jgi:hypothetical protein